MTSLEQIEEKSTQLQNKIESLSDDFCSTFTVVQEHPFVVLVNLFGSKEMPVVKNLISKHFPDKKAYFRLEEEVAADYYLWSIEIR